MDTINTLKQLQEDLSALPQDQDGFVAFGAVLGVIDQYIDYLGKCEREDDIELILSSLSTVVERLEIVELKVREIDPRKDR